MSETYLKNNVALTFEVCPEPIVSVGVTYQKSFQSFVPTTSFILSQMKLYFKKYQDSGAGTMIISIQKLVGGIPDEVTLASTTFDCSTLTESVLTLVTLNFPNLQLNAGTEYVIYFTSETRTRTDVWGSSTAYRTAKYYQPSSWYDAGGSIYFDLIGDIPQTPLGTIGTRTIRTSYVDRPYRNEKGVVISS